MGVISRPVRAGAVAAMGLAITAFTGTLASAGAATPAPGASLGYVALANSVSPTTDTVTGRYSSSKMQVEVAVASRDEAGLNSMLAALYDKNSPSLPPLPDDRAVRRPLRAHPGGPGCGGQVPEQQRPDRGAVGFAVHGARHRIERQGTEHLPHHAEHLQGLRTAPSYFANSTPVYVPSSIAGSALGVIGLTNTVRDAQHVFHFNNTMRRPAEGVGDDQLRDGLSHQAAAVRLRCRRGQLRRPVTARAPAAAA